MAAYKELINKITKLKENVAIFRKVILHSHSPDSYDYARLVKRKGKTVFSTQDKKTVEYSFKRRV